MCPAPLGLILQQHLCPANLGPYFLSWTNPLALSHQMQLGSEPNGWMSPTGQGMGLQSDRMFFSSTGPWFSSPRAQIHGSKKQRRSQDPDDTKKQSARSYCFINSLVKPTNCQDEQEDRQTHEVPASVTKEDIGMGGSRCFSG